MSSPIVESIPMENPPQDQSSGLLTVLIMFALFYYTCKSLGGSSYFAGKRSHNTNMRWHPSKARDESFLSRMKDRMLGNKKKSPMKNNMSSMRSKPRRSNMVSSSYDYNGSPVDISINDPVNYMRSASQITVPSSRTVERQLIDDSIGITEDISKDINTDSDMEAVDQHLLKKNLEGFTSRPSSMTSQRFLVTGS